jgi:SAM-dependent methyltransferase
MLLPNNSHIDVATLNAKGQAMAAHRRRKTPLFAGQNLSAATLGANDASGLSAMAFQAQPSNWRSFIKQIPVIGPLIKRIAQRTRQISAPGLPWKQRFRLIPILGVLSVWVKALATLHTTRQQLVNHQHQLHYFEVATKRVLAEMHFRLAHIESLNMELRLNRLDALNLASRLDQFDALDLASRLDQFDALDLASRLDQFDTLNIAARFNQFDTLNIAVRLDQLDVSSTQVTTGSIQQSNHIAAIKRELLRLSSPRTTLPILAESAMTSQTAPVADAGNANTDSFYIEFEDTFRGAREDIAQRLHVYLPYLTPFAGDATAHMVDVGCGRGEWLGLLQQQGYNATGIDLNQDMVDACHAEGLQAQCQDAIAYLRQQPEGSLVLVTGFHLIEHLPFEILLALFDAALHALRPDGLIIFETPNPENIKVGACNFYTDPTHLNPIVPDVAQFIARQRGFAHAELLRLHPYPESHMLVEDSELAKRFNAAFYGPQDYAVVAWKTHAI